MQSIWHCVQPSSVHYCSWVTNLRPQAASTSRRYRRSNRQGSRQTVQHMHTRACTLFVYFSHMKLGHTPYLRCHFFLSAALSLTRKHTQGSGLFIEHLWVGVGGTMAALLHQAQTRSQINILSPVGQPVQAGLSASESLPPGFHMKEKKGKKTKQYPALIQPVEEHKLNHIYHLWMTA